MTYDLTTMAAVLDDLRAPLRDIVKAKIHVLSWAQKSPIRGGGKQVLQPVITADDTGLGWVSDGGAIAAAANATPVELAVPYRYYAGRLRVSGPDIEAVGEDKSQMEDAIGFAADRMVNSVTSDINRFAVSGGRCLGFLNEHESKIAGSTWELTGDLTKVQTLITAVGAPIAVDLIRMDTYATVSAEVISAVDQTTGLVTIDGAADTSAVAAGYGIAVVCTDAIAGAQNPDIQCQGILGSLGLQTTFGVDRSVAANALLRSNILTLATAGDHDRAAPTLARMQAVLDLVMERTRGHGRPNRAFINPAMYAGLTTLLQGTITLNVDNNDGKRVVDAGFAGFSYAGIPFEVDVDIPKGGIFFVQDDTWSTYMMREGDWDGTPYQVQGADAVEQVWKQYFNLGCFGPNFNGALVGLTFPGSGSGTG